MYRGLLDYENHMLSEWLLTEYSSLLLVFISACGAYAAIVVFTRIAGTRSFSKMSSFDFAITVAFGSLLAATIIAKDPPMLQGIMAIGSLYALQFLVAVLRRHFPAAGHLVDNKPLLLMRGSEILERNLTHCRVTKSDLYAKLREANVLDYSQIRAVVMEATGDISVLHSGNPDHELNPDLLAGVQDYS